MAFTLALITLFASLVRSTPLDARQNRVFCGTQAIAAKQCLDQGGPSFVSSFCSSYLPIRTVTEQTTLTDSSTVTSFTTVTEDTSIVTADATTTTEIDVITTGVTLTTTDATSFIATSTSTSFTSTVFTTEFSTDTVFTCPTAAVATDAIATGTATAEDVTEEDGLFMMNRIFAEPTPSCLATYLGQRLNPVARGCRCQFLPTPTSIQTVLARPTTVVTTTVAGSTTTPIITQLTSTTDIATSLQPVTLNATSITTELAVFTSTITSVTTVTSPSPVPSLFNLARLPAGTIQPNATNATTPSVNSTGILALARLSQPAGASAPLINFGPASNATATAFGLGPAGQLIIPDFTSNTSNTSNTSTSYIVAGRAIPDFLPFLYLQPNEDVPEAQAPICSACDGVLNCQYPGTADNVFATCFSGQYLALGPVESFSGVDGGCELVTLGVSPVFSISRLARTRRWS
ncbi:hypothetical protein MBLNU230_g4104t1 [Neophaeotheca triangularis]